MDTPDQHPQPTGLEVTVLMTLLALTVTAFSVALLGSAEKSERGFRLLNWLDQRS